MTVSVALSPSRRIVAVSPSTVSSEAKVTCGRPSRSASMAGTTDMMPSVEAMPVRTRSGRPIFSIALASTRDVAIASEPCRASSWTWTALSAPICSDLRIAVSACSGPTVSTVTELSPPAASLSLSASSTAYSSSSLSNPSTPTRSVVLSVGLNVRSAWASGTYLTQTTISMGPEATCGARRATCSGDGDVAHIGPGSVPVGGRARLRRGRPRPPGRPGRLVARGPRPRTGRGRPGRGRRR